MSSIEFQAIYTEKQEKSNFNRKRKKTNQETVKKAEELERTGNARFMLNTTERISVALQIETNTQTN